MVKSKSLWRPGVKKDTKRFKCLSLLELWVIAVFFFLLTFRFQVFKNELYFTLLKKYIFRF